MENEVDSQNIYDKFHDFAVRPHSNPIAALGALEDLINQMDERGMRKNPDTYAPFVRAWPQEYSHPKDTLQAMKHRDRHGIFPWLIRGIPTRSRRGGRGGLPSGPIKRSCRVRAAGGADHGATVEKNWGGQGRGHGGNSSNGGAQGNNSSSGGYSGCVRRNCSSRC